MEVSLRAPYKTDHFHLTLVKKTHVRALPRVGSIYPHLWSKLRFRVEEINHLKDGRGTAVILEALPESLEAFVELVNKLNAPIPIRPEDRSSVPEIEGWSLLPHSKGPDLFTKEEWELIKKTC